MSAKECVAIAEHRLTLNDAQAVRYVFPQRSRGDFAEG
jgi:hypothetical protein